MMTERSAAKTPDSRDEQIVIEGLGERQGQLTNVVSLAYPLSDGSSARATKDVI